MREHFLLLVPFGAALAIYLPFLRRFSFWIAFGASLVMALLERGSFSWVWGVFSFAFLLGWFVEASPFAPFWAILSLGVARVSFLFPGSIIGSLLLSSSLLLILPSLWEFQELDLSGVSVFLLLASVPFLTFNFPEEWRLVIVLATLLGVFPFHLWIRSAMEGGPSLGALFLVTGFRAIVIFWLGREGLGLADGVPEAVLSWLGVISILWGSLRALAAADWGEMCAYASLAEAGMMLMLLIKGGLEASFIYSILMGLSLLALGAGSWGTKLFMEEGHPVAPAAFLLLVGILATAGLPLTPGFSAMTLVFDHLEKWEGLLAVVCGIGVMSGGMRLLKPLALAFRVDLVLKSPRVLILIATAVIFWGLGFAL